MTSLRRRALARVLAVHIAAVAVVMTLSAGAEPAPSFPYADTVATDAAYGEQLALVAQRVSASPGAHWAYGAETVGVDDTVVAVYLRRSVSRNPIPPSIEGNAVLEEAAKYVGTPYVSGGTTPAGFDCSGFVSYVYAKFGISLPRSSDAYWNVGTRVSPQDARPGDIIVSSGHVAIYAGGSLQVDSPRPGKTIQFREIWQTSYIFIRVS